MTGIKMFSQNNISFVRKGNALLPRLEFIQIFCSQAGKKAFVLKKAEKTHYFTEKAGIVWFKCNRHLNITAQVIK